MSKLSAPDSGPNTKTFMNIVGLTFLAGLVAALIALPLVKGISQATRDQLNGDSSLPADITQIPLPRQNTLVDAKGNVLATLFSQNRIEVPLDHISPLLQRAVVAIEDQRFLHHSGIDLKGTLRAAISTGTGSQVQGGSTITQQYVKQLLLAAAKTPEERKAATEQSVTRKLKEARYALALETQLSKVQILEGYLNIAYFGAGAYGAEAAARRYFSEPASDLTLTQAATLAGLVQNPSRYDPTQFPQLAETRRDMVLQAMANSRFITREEALAAEDVSLIRDLKPATIPNGCASSYAPFFCDYVLTILMSDKAFGQTREQRAQLLALGGLRVVTTLSPKGQKAAQRAVDSKIPYQDPSGKAAAITMMQPGTGRIVAMAQDRKWGTKGVGYTTVNYNAPLNHNGTVGFQAGSTFKPFTLAAALNQNINPYSYLPGFSPMTFYNFYGCKDGARFEPYQVRNSTGAGTFNMISGTAYSINTFFVGLEEKTGLCGPVKMAKNAGVQLGNGKDLPALPCFTLGCFDVTTLDMAEGMATFAAHGIHCNPIAITKIIDRNGRELPVPSANCKHTIPRTVADSVAAIMAGVISGPLYGRTGADMYFGRPAAGKTGTTDEAAAVWFVGFTPDLAGAVWVGDPRGGQAHPMQNIVINGVFYPEVFGKLMPGPIWRDSMAGALAHSRPAQWHLKTKFGLVAGGGTGASYIPYNPCAGLKGDAWRKCKGIKPR